MYTTLKKLLNVTALATGEASVNALIKTLIAPYCDEVYTDPVGNLICLKKGSGEDKKKIMLAAHSDENGFVATYVENNGLIRFDTCGEPDLTSAAYGEIEFENGVRGILIPEDSANLNVRKMHVDIGAKNAQEAEKKGGCGGGEQGGAKRRADRPEPLPKESVRPLPKQRRGQ